MMTTNYATKTLTTAFKNHLLGVDLIPPSADLSKLASDLTQVCLLELNEAGLESDTIEEIFAPHTFTATTGSND